MNKVKIGIVPTSHIFENDDPYEDKYSFINNYCKRISENGGIPVGILLSDGKLDEASLEMCDAFLICGGNRIQPFSFKVINYAIKNNKPLLGICLGMQTIGLYSYLESELIKREISLDYENFIKMYDEVKEKGIFFTKPVEGHYVSDILRNSYIQNMHDVYFSKDSILNNIYNRDNLSVVSMHSFQVALLGENVMIGSKDKVGVPESIEYKNKDLFILGVQWHPEVEDKHNVLFKWLIDEAKRRL